MAQPRGKKLVTPSGELTAKQVAFIEAYIANGGQKGKAAIAAGYAEGHANVEAYRLLQNPTVIKELHRQSVLALGAAAPQAVATITNLSSRAKSEYVRLEAAKDLLDRVGLKAPERMQVVGDIKVSIDLS